MIPSAKFAKSDELMARIRAAMTEKGADAWFEAGAQRALPQGSRRQPRRLGAGHRHSRRVVRTPAPPTPSRWRIPRRSRSSPASSASATAATIASCTWKAPTSTAAGSSPRCWRAAARAGARPSTWCSRTASSSTRRARRRCRSRSGNTLSPQELMKTSGADILRLWVASSDYSERHPLRARHPAGNGRVLSQAQKYAALDAGQACAPRCQGAGRCVGDARAGAADAASAGGARRAHPQGLR